jgi:hypothetical protein
LLAVAKPDHASLDFFREEVELTPGHHVK